MAFWVRGGGEQTPGLGPCCGEGKRAYYVCDDEHQHQHQQSHQQQQQRAPAFDDEPRPLGPPRGHGFAELQAKHYLMARLGPAHHAVRPHIPHIPHIPERDIPYPSIEPRDTPTPAPEETHVFFILHEEGSDASEPVRSFSSQSPLPARDALSASPVPKDWSNGSDLKAFASGGPYYSPQLFPARSTKPQRYEEWRDLNGAYDMAAEQEEESRSFSPFILLSSLPERRQTPEAAASPHDHGHGIVHIHNRHHYGQQHETPMVPALSCSVRDPNASSTSSSSPSLDEALMTDAEAASSVAAHLAGFNRRCPSSRHERILLGLIHPKSADAEFELDHSALESIFSAANEIFFGGRLTQRVQWDWTDAASHPQYDSNIIGHTSLRRVRGGGLGGFETFILLSTPILKSREYSRRLLISAFLHELIHCYLFVCCGWSAREAGGHTDGFRRIADTIDRWAGRENLYLCHVEADLERFRQAAAVTAVVPEAADGTMPSPSEGEYYGGYSGGYSLASPVFYDDRVCCPTKTNTDWERCIHDRWDDHHHQDVGQPDRAAYPWA